MFRIKQYIMAIINQLKKNDKESNKRQKEVVCKYSIGSESNGNKYLQIETFRAEDKNGDGASTQNIRLTEKAIKQLTKILINDILLK